MTYCAIDAMSFLLMPLEQFNRKKQLYENKYEVGREDFITWVERYMKTDITQPYQYRGIDLYGARCGIVHNYGVESDLSRKGKCKVFAYKPNCLKHFYDPLKHPNIVVIGVELFIQDFYGAVDRFLADIETNDELRQRVDHRLPHLFMIKRKAPT